MSLLSELLSKVRHLEQKKEVPPGLRSAVSDMSSRDFRKKKFVILAVFVIIAAGSGLFTVYFIKKTQTSTPKPNIAEIRQRHQARNLEIQEKPGALPTPTEPAKQPSAVSSQAQEEKSAESSAKKTEASGGLQPDNKAKQIQASRPKSSRKIRKPDEGNSPASEETGFLNAEKPKPDTSERDLYLYMAQNYESKGDFANALASYKKILDMEPGNYRVLNNIASILIQLNSDTEARTYLQQAFRHRSDYVPGLINMGIVLARLGENAESEKHLLQAINLQPANTHAMLNLAILYEKNSSFDKAREYYLKLQKSGDAQGSAGIERLKAVSGNQ